MFPQGTKSFLFFSSQKKADVFSHGFILFNSPWS